MQRFRYHDKLPSTKPSLAIIFSLRHTPRYSICSSPICPIFQMTTFRPKMYFWYLVWVILWINWHMNAKKNQLYNNLVDLQCKCVRQDTPRIGPIFGFWLHVACLLNSKKFRILWLCYGRKPPNLANSWGIQPHTFTLQIHQTLELPHFFAFICQFIHSMTHTKFQKYIFGSLGTLVQIENF